MLAAGSTSLASWLDAHGGGVSPGVRLAQSSACGGLGVFATRSLASLEPLATIPLSACISASDAVADDEIGPAVRSYLKAQRGKRGAANAVAVAALLALARQASSAGARKARGDIVASESIAVVSCLREGGAYTPVCQLLASHALADRA